MVSLIGKEEEEEITGNIYIDKKIHPSSIKII